MRANDAMNEISTSKYCWKYMTLQYFRSLSLSIPRVLLYYSQNAKRIKKSSRPAQAMIAPNSVLTLSMSDEISMFNYGNSIKNLQCIMILEIAIELRIRTLPSIYSLCLLRCFRVAPNSLENAKSTYADWGVW